MPRTPDHKCPLCGKPIARGSNKMPGSVKGLLALHTKYMHPESYRGEPLPKKPKKVVIEDTPFRRPPGVNSKSKMCREDMYKAGYCMFSNRECNLYPNCGWRPGNRVHRFSIGLREYSAMFPVNDILQKTG